MRKNMETIILDAAQELARLIDNEEAVVTNAILIGECIGPDGDRWLTAGSTGMSPWTALGMLEAEVIRSKQNLMASLFHGEGQDDDGE